MKRIILLTIIVLCGVSLFAQTAIGSFSSHIAVNKFISVASDASTIYAATDNGLHNVSNLVSAVQFAKFFKPYKLKYSCPATNAF